MSGYRFAVNCTSKTTFDLDQGLANRTLLSGPFIQKATSYGINTTDEMFQNEKFFRHAPVKTL